MGETCLGRHRRPLAAAARQSKFWRVESMPYLRAASALLIVHVLVRGGVGIDVGILGNLGNADQQPRDAVRRTSGGEDSTVRRYSVEV
jgi:hypothetical protein